jgi:hypothetical protein
MIIKEYRIKQIATLEEDPIKQWQIQIQLKFSWIERKFLGHDFTENRTMIGSCTSWKWGDESPVDYFWKLWAFNAVRNRTNKAKEVTYVNRRTNRSKDE